MVFYAVSISVSGHLDEHWYIVLAWKLYYQFDIFFVILSYQGLRLSNLTLGPTALIFSDWIRHKPKIVTINMINHKAVQKIDKHQASR